MVTTPRVAGAAALVAAWASTASAAPFLANPSMDGAEIGTLTSSNPAFGAKRRGHIVQPTLRKDPNIAVAESLDIANASAVNGRLRRQLEAANEDLERLEQYFGQPMERNFKTLQASYRSGKIDPAPWPASYWPTYLDSINYRFVPSDPSPAEKYAQAFGFDVKDFSDRVSGGKGIDLWYDRKPCRQDWDCSGLGDGSTCAIRRGKTSGVCIPRWWGICHAWAPASILEPEPKCNVQKNGVTFTPRDLKGLMTAIYDDAKLGVVFTGARYDGSASSAKKDKYGRYVDAALRDIGPGFFHIAVTNIMGRFKKSFVVDVTADAPVWNQPVLGYDIQELRIVDTAAASMQFFGTTKYPFNAEMKYLAYASMRFRYIVESSDDGPHVPGRIPQFTTTVTYEYLLELDLNYNIIGGEWVRGSRYQHPDFLWFTTGKPRDDLVTYLGMSYKEVRDLIDASFACKPITPAPTTPKPTTPAPTTPAPTTPTPTTPAPTTPKPTTPAPTTPKPTTTAPTTPKPTTPAPTTPTPTTPIPTTLAPTTTKPTTTPPTPSTPKPTDPGQTPTTPKPTNPGQSPVTPSPKPTTSTPKPTDPGQTPTTPKPTNPGQSPVTPSPKPTTSTPKPTDPAPYCGFDPGQTPTTPKPTNPGQTPTTPEPTNPGQSPVTPSPKPTTSTPKPTDPGSEGELSQRNGQHPTQSWLGVFYAQSSVGHYDDYDGSVCARRAGQNSGYCIPTWFGICHAWAPAAILEPEPRCDVVKNGVTFRAYDIKGLVTAVYDGAHLPTVFTGARFNGPDKPADLDKYGRYTDAARRDLGAGFFHLAVTNIMGKFKQSFVVDVTAGAEVWNQPVRSYRITDMTIMSPSEGSMKYFGTEVYPFNKDAKFLAKTTMSFSYVVEANEDGQLVPSRVDRYTRSVKYEYFLELDSNYQVIGGEWLGNSRYEHPDFLWLATSRPDENSVTPIGLSYKEVRALVQASSTCQTPAPATTSPSPVTTVPATTTPATTKPATATPSTSSPATAVPATATPATTKPATSTPSTTSPAMTKPATATPATTKPATTTPPTTSPATTKPATNVPGTSAPAPQTTSPSPNQQQQQQQSGGKTPSQSQTDPCNILHRRVSCSIFGFWCSWDNGANVCKTRVR
ncbi:hypothetical protein P43SY_008508 [Pythium insidiosum]|uniref:Elicitor-like transglutaminase n=1 Tax=Pythium insidiosum TaxID=114742 RepID=A0AAD5LU78_PYTIN|nr:hypothetical protein P43SY_008508 [Pythium insidiosum]